MKPSAAAIAVIKKFEVNYHGVVALDAYDDGYGNCTIGWGRVQGVCAGDKINLATAELYFDEDLGIAARAVDHALKVPVSQAHYDALCVFSYNCRSGVAPASSVMKAINAGRLDDVPALWMRYQYAVDLKTKKHTLSNGLVRRRRAELELWRGLATSDSEQALALLPGSITNAKPGAVLDALKTSWTLRGLLIALGGKVAEVFGHVTGFFANAQTEMAQLKASADPMLAMWTTVKGSAPDLAAGFVIAGLGLAAWRRLEAAKEGKPG